MHLPIPGTRVSLIPPAGFGIARHFQGLEDEARGLSIEVTELPQPMTAGAEGEDVTVDGHPGVLLRSVRTGGVETVAVWILTFGDHAQTVFVGATAPLELREALDGPLREALLSARWSPEAPPPLDDLPYRLTESPPLRIATRMGTVVLLTELGTVGLTAGAPMMTIGHLPHDRDDDLAQVSADHLGALPGLEGMAPTSAEELTLATGEPAFELLADGLSSGDALPIRVYQLVTRVGDQEVIAVGRAASERFDAVVDAFRAIARSLRQ